MRRALATAALVGGIVLTPVAASPALAAVPHAAPALTSSGTNVDEPGDNGNDDDSGRWGLGGLLGLFGLFGYKKYKEHRASTGAAGQPIGTVDGDGTGSRRI